MGLEGKGTYRSRSERQELKRTEGIGRDGRTKEWNGRRGKDGGGRERTGLNRSGTAGMDRGGVERNG